MEGTSGLKWETQNGAVGTSKCVVHENEIFVKFLHRVMFY